MWIGKWGEQFCIAATSKTTRYFFFFVKAALTLSVGIPRGMHCTVYSFVLYIPIEMSAPHCSLLERAEVSGTNSKKQQQQTKINNPRQENFNPQQHSVVPTAGLEESPMGN